MIEFLCGDAQDDFYNEEKWRSNQDYNPIVDLQRILGIIHDTSFIRLQGGRPLSAVHLRSYLPQMVGFFNEGDSSPFVVKIGHTETLTEDANALHRLGQEIRPYSRLGVVHQDVFTNNDFPNISMLVSPYVAGTPVTDKDVWITNNDVPVDYFFAQMQTWIKSTYLTDDLRHGLFVSDGLSLTGNTIQTPNGRFVIIDATGTTKKEGKFKSEQGLMSGKVVQSAFDDLKTSGVRLTSLHCPFDEVNANIDLSSVLNR